MRSRGRSLQESSPEPESMGRILLPHIDLQEDIPFNLGRDTRNRIDHATPIVLDRLHFPSVSSAHMNKKGALP